MADYYLKLPPSGGGGGSGVSSLNSLTGALTLTGGTGITVTPSGSNITISATGGGTVTSVGLAAPAVFTVSGSPVTTSGTLTFAFIPAPAATFLAGPPFGTGSGDPVFRALRYDDIPFIFVDSLVIRGPNVSLVNDSNTPGNNSFYGTDGTGTKGFFQQPVAVDGNLNLLGAPAAGSALAGGYQNVFLGVGAGSTVTTGANNVAIGTDSANNAAVNRQVAIGSTASTGAVQATAVGYHSSATGASSTAIGDTATVSGSSTGAVALGQLSTVSANDGIAIGHSASATAAGAIAIGLSASATSANKIVIGSAQTANFVMASPDGSTGSLTPRALVAADLPFNILSFTSSPGAGGAATEAMTVTGLLATDTILAVSQSVQGANSLPLIGYNTLANNSLTGVWSADPGAGSVIVVSVKR